MGPGPELPEHIRGYAVDVTLGDADAFRLVANGEPVEETYEPGRVRRLAFH
ncbi:hypothetical protein ACFY40_18615 [Streptomyces sp. NPDC012950]|uniref:hypothetical protein n=1 Tax=Streptomyces sp. NPDC012950 TaxID=3364858 RepID=UPI0036ABF6D8